MSESEDCPIWEWSGKTESEVTKAFGKPDRVLDVAGATSWRYLKGHYYFMFKDGLVEYAFDTQKRDAIAESEFKRGNRMRDWQGKASADVIQAFGEPTSGKMDYYSDLERGNFSLWVYGKRHLPFHVRESDGIVTGAFDRRVVDQENGWPD